jgi:hypothetical protein
MVNVSDHRVQKAANFVIESLNNLVKDHKICETWQLKSIDWALIRKLNDDKLKKLADKELKVFNILVKIEAKPGIKNT